MKKLYFLEYTPQRHNRYYSGFDIFVTPLCSSAYTLVFSMERLAWLISENAVYVERLLNLKSYSLCSLHPLLLQDKNSAETNTSSQHSQGSTQLHLPKVHKLLSPRYANSTVYPTNKILIKQNLFYLPFTLMFCCQAKLIPLQIQRLL